MTHAELLDMPILYENYTSAGETVNIVTVFEDPTDGRCWKATYWRSADFTINTLLDGSCHIEQAA